MSNIFIYIGSFIFGLSILVAFHEFGHFWVARKLGVKVLTFSIGFGKPAWCFYTDKDGTKYQLAAWPFGGYVRMLGEYDNDVDPADAHRAINRQALWKRSAIAAAGPIANFLLAIVLLTAMYMYGVQSSIPVVGEPIAESVAAEAGIKKGMQLKSIEGDAVLSYESATMQIIAEGIKGRQVNVEVVAEGSNVTEALVLDFRGERRLLKDPNVNKTLGLTRNLPPVLVALVNEVVEGSGAAKAGLQSGDIITALDGTAVVDMKLASKYIQARPGQDIKVTYQREGIEQNTVVTTSSDIDSKGAEPVGRFGVMFNGNSQEDWDKISFVEQYGLFGAVKRSLAQTYEMSIMTLRFVGNLITGNASLRTLSGPVGIAEFAGNSASAGIAPYLFFLGIISINLAVFNLLPLPVLDGGLLFFNLIEWIKGSPVKEHIQEMSFRIGVITLLSVMLIASYMDITRIFG